jgi:CRP-like cAMP-binding protein
MASALYYCMVSGAVPDGTVCGNEILDRVPKDVCAQFQEMASRVQLRMDEEVMRQDDPVRHLYFPTTAVLSLVVGLASGQRAEFGTVGREGVAGVSGMLSPERSLGSAIVQLPGESWVIDFKNFQRLRAQSMEFREAISDYIAYSYRVAAQSTVCVAFHPIEKRLARWLLIAHDRARVDEVPMKQEMMATMVAASRPRVNEAAIHLRRAGLIDYHAGRLRIMDRAGLERAACECYAVTRRA